MKKFFKDFGVVLSANQKKDFRREALFDNFNKLCIISVIIFIMELVSYVIPPIMLDLRDITLTFLLSSLVLIPIIFLVKNKLENKSPIPKGYIYAAYAVMYLYIAAVVSMGVAVAIRSQASSDFVHTYLITIIAVAALLNLNIIERSAIIVLFYAVFVTLLYIYQPDKAKASFYAFNTFTINIIAWVLSHILYSYRKKGFVNSKELQRLALCDSMTMFYNHETILAMLETEISISNARNTQLSIIMIDIDNFKEINDTQGHITGDLVIKELSRIILSLISPSDTVGRYGGDEFLIILPDKDSASATQIGEALMEDAARCSVPITLSAGISEYRGESLNEYVKRVDKKLYKAKAQGKNRIVDRER